MNFFKSIVKTFLFCTFMTIIVSTTGDITIFDINNEEYSISVCSEEYPNSDCSDFIR